MRGKPSARSRFIAYSGLVCSQSARGAPPPSGRNARVERRRGAAPSRGQVRDRASRPPRSRAPRRRLAPRPAASPAPAPPRAVSWRFPTTPRRPPPGSCHSKGATGAPGASGAHRDLPRQLGLTCSSVLRAFDVLPVLLALGLACAHGKPSAGSTGAPPAPSDTEERAAAPTDSAVEAQRQEVERQRARRAERLAAIRAQVDTLLATEARVLWEILDDRPPGRPRAQPRLARGAPRALHARRGQGSPRRGAGRRATGALALARIPRRRTPRPRRAAARCGAGVLVGRAGHRESRGCPHCSRPSRRLPPGGARARLGRGGARAGTRRRGALGRHRRGREPARLRLLAGARRRAARRAGGGAGRAGRARPRVERRLLPRARRCARARRARQGPRRPARP